MKIVLRSLGAAIYIVLFYISAKAPATWLLLTSIVSHNVASLGLPGDFAGLSLPEKSQEILVQIQQPEGIPQVHEGSSRLAKTSIVQEAANTKGVSADMLAAIVTIESNGNPMAVSPSGAKGIAQIMPIFQKQFCPGVNLFDTRQNLECSAAGLAWLSDYFNGDEDKIVMAYHGGASRISSGQARPVDYEYLRRYKSVLGYGANQEVVVVPSAIIQQKASASGQQPTTLPNMITNLYGSTNWRQSQGAHAALNLGVAAYDFVYACGVPLYAPLNGVITYKGDDGFNIGNTMLSIRGEGGSVHLLHGNYTIPSGSTVFIGDVIGTEASNGRSTGCHTHFVHSRLTMN